MSADAVATNRATQNAHSFSCLTSRPAGPAPSTELADRGPAPTHEVDRRDLCEALCRLLPRTQAAVLRVLFFEQLSPAAAAQTLRLSSSRLFELRRAALAGLRANPRAARMLADAAA